VPLGDVWGRFDERVAAGGPAALLEVVRERLREAGFDPLARAAALRMARPGARVAELGPELSA
jgi:hypothetical protein